MNVATTVTTVLIVVSTATRVVIDNCCSVTAKGNYFATKRPPPGIYTIMDPCSTTTSGHSVQGYCHTLIDGWWEYEQGFW